MAGDVNSHNTNIAVKTRITFHFYGGLALAIILLFSLIYFAISAHNTFVVVLIGAGIFIGITLVIFVLLELAHKAVQVKGDHRKTTVLHADDHRIVLLEGGLFNKKPVVYETNNTRVNYNIKQVDTPQVVEADTPKQIAAPSLLPEYIRYEDIRHQIPQGQTLLGVGEQGILETRDFSVLDTCWICGGSKTGKTNTVSLKVEEGYNLGHKFIVVDPHRFKSDSLHNAIKGYSSAFLLPVAQSHEEIVSALKQFLAEARARRSGGHYDYDITLIMDEVGSLTGDKGKTEEQKELYQLIYNIARMCGQELRGFGMRGKFISQNAIGLAWLRSFAMTIIVHKLLMENERKVATNSNMQIVNAMDTWPRGRILVYGLDIPEGQLVRQMPLFTPRQQAVVDDGFIEPLASNPYQKKPTWEYEIPRMPRFQEQVAFPSRFHHPETASQANKTKIIDGVFTPVQQGNESSEKRKVSEVGNEIRETIKRMNKRGTSHREIAYAVGLSGRKYPLYQQVCREEGIVIEQEA